MKALLLQILGELLLALVAAELAGWLPRVADAVLRLAARYYPEQHRAEQLSEWRDHLGEYAKGGMHLSRLYWALVILGSSIRAGWYRHGRPTVGQYLEIYRLENALRAAQRERIEVEFLRHNRLARLTVVGKRALTLLAVWCCAGILGLGALLLGGLFPDSGLAFSTAILILVFAMYLGNVRGAVVFTCLLDAGLAAVMASVYTRYQPRADRRIAQLEKRLLKLKRHSHSL